jgi:hypothetical protein
LSIALALAALALSGCGSSAAPHPPAAPNPPSAPQRPSGSAPVIAAAGDIACPLGDAPLGACHQGSTAQLLSLLRPDAVLPLGDDQYETGALDAFRSSYAPTWGRFNAIVRPVPGNHEYLTRDAAGYYAYFGARAGNPAGGYYSYDIGAWHLIALNSNCEFVPCAPGSPQERWLRADLAAHPRRCTLAYWHYPRFTSGPHRNDVANIQSVAPLWRALYAAGADIVLNAHDHDYERFAPQTPAGRADPLHGIREFVVGTGGRDHYPIQRPRPNSERHNDSTYGVLALTLRPDGYSWRFVPEAGAQFTDSGSTRCH